MAENKFFSRARTSAIEEALRPLRVLLEYLDKKEIEPKTTFKIAQSILLTSQSDFHKEVNEAVCEAWNKAQPSMLMTVDMAPQKV